MFTTLNISAQEVANWSWSQIEPYFADLQARELTEATLDSWLRDWTQIAQLVLEAGERLYVASTLDTTDTARADRYHAYLDQVVEPYMAASQRLKEKLLASNLEAPGFGPSLRQMRAEAEIFREENLPLLTEEQKLTHEYGQIIGTQTVQWEGEEKTLPQLKPIFQSSDRTRRARAWYLATERQLQDREAINDLWTRLMDLRGRIARNAGLPDYRAYKWKQYGRFDYTPEDCLRFHDAIEEVVVPAVERIYERRCRKLGIDSIRPWDKEVDPSGKPPLRPFDTVDELIERGAAIFRAIDPQLGAYFDRMIQGNLLDLENRKGKAPGGYCDTFLASGEPFIFMNAVGIHDDVQTLLHEGGHAFHAFEAAKLPYFQQKDYVPTEFSEVASMSMELLGQPYLARPIGFYEPEDAARATIKHLEGLLEFWPYMAVVDAFQHWVYTNHAEASDPANCDAKWAELWRRFMRAEDWSGLDEAMETGWHRKLHIHEIPLYYIEYGLAQLGAVQVWRNSLRDERQAIASYRSALALGNTKTLPELFAAAGAKFKPDVATLRECVDLIEQTLDRLERA
ncbi:MAG: M3 family oligoendopeptidase [Chloroflexota bacterium]|nr:MAG: M3 family oligoendopeptidase [Chloroflexota bacterium]